MCLSIGTCSQVSNVAHGPLVIEVLDNMQYFYFLKRHQNLNTTKVLKKSEHLHHFLGKRHLYPIQAKGKSGAGFEPTNLCFNCLSYVDSCNILYMV